MFELPQTMHPLSAFVGLTGSLLLVHCGSASSSGHAGTAGVAAQSRAGNGGDSGDDSNGSTAGGAAPDGGTSSGGGSGGTPSGGNPNGVLLSGGAAGESGEGGAGGTSTEATNSAGTANQSAGSAGSTCTQELLTFSSPSAEHVSVCSEITYSMNPPVYGDHYPVWAAYKSYSFPVPLGFLVHDLEHGAVELLYNCPEGCPDEVAIAQAFLDALPMDPRCTPEVKHQTILSPDPTLPTRWAAVAWGHSLTSSCFDGIAFQTFYDANIGHGPEDLCSDGTDLGSNPCL